MKRILLSGIAIFSCLLGFSQAPVPTSWDFETPTPPTGWTLSNGATNQFYSSTSACNSAASCRLDATNDALIIYLADQPGTVTYDLWGKTASTPWDGTFVVQESVDGSSWVTFKTYTGSGAMSVSGCTAETASPTNPLSRYIRFFFQNKISGSNISLDNVNITNPVITAATLKVNQNSSSGPAILNAGYSQAFGSSVGVALPVTFAFSNIGTVQTLNITNVAISGTNASDFAVTTGLPVNVNPASNSNFIITFTPSAAGTRTAVCTITSNSSVNPTFTFTLYGVGGTLATEPTASAENMAFTNVKSFRYNVNFGAASQAPDILGGYLVLRKKGSAVTEIPVDGTTYKRGQSIGNAKVVYIATQGSNLGFVPLDITASSTYHYAVYTFNGGGSYANYKTSSPAIGSVTTLNTMQAGNEYASVSVSSPTFVSDLTGVINPHTSIFYGNYAISMINRFTARDTFVTVGANTFDKVVDCSYSSDKALYNIPFDWTALDYSREHTYAHSWMPSFPADNPEQPEYDDQHNLYPTRQTNVNELRCNYPFGDVQTVTTQYLGAKLGTNLTGQTVFEPKDVQKGRTARALMYMATSYNTTGTNWGFPNPIGVCLSAQIDYGQDQYLVKKWHFDHLPDAFDRSRNDFIDSAQGNRNPFVDSIRYACFIDFTNMQKWQPSLAIIGTELQTEQGVAFQWFKDGVQLSGVNTQNFTPTVDGVYTVSVQQFTQCPFIESKTVTVSGAGIENSDKNGNTVQAFPNPNAGEFTLKIESSYSEKAVVKIIDITGRILIQGNYQLNAGTNNIHIVQALASGKYYVNIESAHVKANESFLVK